MRFVAAKEAFRAKDLNKLPPDSVSIAVLVGGGAVSSVCVHCAGLPGGSVWAVFRAAKLFMPSLKAAILEDVLTALSDLAPGESPE